MSIEDVITSAAAGGMSTGSPWGAIGAGVLNYMGTQSTNQQNADIAASNNAWSAQQYATRYQTMVKDLEAAGLNPMLAYSQSPGSAPSAQQVQFQNPMSSAVQGYNDVLGTRAKAMSDVSTANKGYAEQEKIDQETEQLKRTLKANGPENEQARIKAITENYVASTNLMNQQKLSEQAKVRHLNQLTANLVAEKVITDAEGKAIMQTGGIGRLARELKPISDMGSDWLGLKGMFDKIKSSDRPRSSETRENKTIFDKDGNPVGGHSTNRSTTER